jgi:nucleotide-binding universal stress UspA family protein
MFEKVLLCYDDSVAGRRVLQRGAELVILGKAKAFVLSTGSHALWDALVAANALGQICLVDSESEHSRFLGEPIAWLKDRGVEAEGYLARGNMVDEIISYSKRLQIDLVVVGHYPKWSGGRWWSGLERACLAERLNCCLFIAVK